MASNKRPTKKNADRPLIRSSHGGAGAAKPPKKRAAAPAAAPKARAGGAGGPRSKREGGGDALKKTKLPESNRSLGATGAKLPSNLSTASDEAREVAVLIAVAGIEKKASGLEVIDVAGRVDYADFLVLMSGRSDRHVTALSNSIEEALRKKNKRPLAVEGLPHANWVLMDFGDVVVHVFQDDARAAYDIDGLWMDARRVPVPIDQQD